MDFDIVYHPGKQNGGPDALRRPPVQRVSSKTFISTLNAAGLTSPQATDPFCVQIKAKSSLPKHFSPSSGVLFFNPRPFFLSLYKRKCSNCSMLAPSSGHHPGLGWTLHRFNRLFYAPNPHEWVKEQVKTCEVPIKPRWRIQSKIQLQYSTTPSSFLQNFA